MIQPFKKWNGNLARKWKKKQTKTKTNLDVCIEQSVFSEYSFIFMWYYETPKGKWECSDSALRQRN